MKAISNNLTNHAVIKPTPQSSFQTRLIQCPMTSVRDVPDGVNKALLFILAIVSSPLSLFAANTLISA